MKTCIFIVGDRNSGKTSTVRSLTGCNSSRLWIVKNLKGRPIKAFVLQKAITEFGGKKHPPNKFPASFEQKFDVNRRDYEILICPFELRTYRKYSLDKYIQNARNQRFNVKVVIIKKDYQGTPYIISNIQNICLMLGIRPLILDITNDYVEEARRIRRRFYPR